MDYSKVKFVKPSVIAIGFTKGKVYPVSGDVSGESPNELPEIIDDKGSVAVICIDMCSHLYGAHWIPCREDGTPLLSLEAEMLAMLEDIHSELINGETPHAYKIEELIKKAKQ